MKELIYSKHLRSRVTQDEIVLYHDLHESSLVLSKNQLMLISDFKSSKRVDNINSQCSINIQNDFLHKMFKKGYINDVTNDEENVVISKWLRQFEKDVYVYNMSAEVKIVYHCRKNEPVSQLPTEIAKICKDMALNFMRWKRPLYIMFLNQKEYTDVCTQFQFPKNTTGFVDSRTLMVLNYEMFFKKENSRLFYPTIRHECMHILLGQYRVNIPAWLEEGICELYSNRVATQCINQDLDHELLISFSELSKSSSYNSVEYELSNITQEAFYKQSQSFTHYLIQSIGLSEFNEIIMNCDLRHNFGEMLTRKTNSSLSMFEKKWMKQIKKEKENEI